MTIYADLVDEITSPKLELMIIGLETRKPIRELISRRRAQIGRAAAELVQAIEPGGGDIVSVTLEVDKILVERVKSPTRVVNGEIATKVHEERVVVYGELRKLEKEKTA